MSEERSVSDVVQDILRNLQRIVRAEVSLAKAEFRQEARRALSSGAWLAAGIVCAISAWLFLLWAVAFGLATWVPMWAAVLIVAAGMGLVAAVLIPGGLRRAKQIHPVPERTVESVKENLEWLKQSMK